MLLIVLILLMTAFFLGLFGVEDLSEALAYTGRFTGALLLLAAGASLLGAVAVVDHWFRRSFAHSGLVALLGTVTAIVANLMLLTTTLRDADSTGYLVLWCLLVVGSVWATITVYRTSVEIPAPKRVAAAVIVTSAIAVANFGYTQLYQPYQHATLPVLQLTVKEPVLNSAKNAVAIPFTINLENRSNVGLYVIGTDFEVKGRTAPVSPMDRLTPAWRGDLDAGHALSLRENLQPPRMVQGNTWAYFNTWLDAGETTTSSRVVELPVDTRFDQLAFRATALIARKDRIHLDTLEEQGRSWHKRLIPPPAGSPAGDYVLYRARLHENNAIAEHTRDPRYITMWWTFGENGIAVISTIDRKGEERNRTAEDTERWTTRYGLSYVETGWIQRSLWDVKRQP